MSYDLRLTQYGFSWGDCLVERTASQSTKPKFQVITVYAPNGEGVEIVMRPRSLDVKKLGKCKVRKGKKK